MSTKRMSTVKVDQNAYQRAMREQGKLKPEYFPVNNRAARRAAASKRKPLEKAI